MTAVVIGRENPAPASGSAQSLSERIADILAFKLTWLNTIWTEPPEGVDAATMPLGYITPSATQDEILDGDLYRYKRVYTVTFLLRAFGQSATNRPLLGIASKLDDVKLALADNELKFEGNKLRGLTKWEPLSDSGYRLVQYPPTQESPVFHGLVCNYRASTQMKWR